MSSANYSFLLVLAESLDGLEKLRMATDNRYRDLIDKKGFPADCHEAVRLRALADSIRALEHGAELDLRREMRKHPLWAAFGKDIKGVGEKQFARLLAAIGDPADRPNPGKLLQYCGHGDPERSRRVKGAQGLPFSPNAKKWVHLVAENVIKAQIRKTADADDAGGYDIEHRVASGPLAQKYLNARRAWIDRDTSDGHKHNHALRIVGKTLLKDLWVVATELRQAKTSPQTRGVAPGEDLGEAA